MAGETEIAVGYQALLEVKIDADTGKVTRTVVLLCGGSGRRAPIHVYDGSDISCLSPYWRRTVASIIANSIVIRDDGTGIEIPF